VPPLRGSILSYDPSPPLTRWAILCRPAGLRLLLPCHFEPSLLAEASDRNRSSALFLRRARAPEVTCYNPRPNRGDMAESDDGAFTFLTELQAVLNEIKLSEVREWLKQVRNDYEGQFLTKFVHPKISTFLQRHLGPEPD
jgi:hypothetical protein